MFEIESLKNILPSHVYASVSENINAEKLQELRLRADRPVCVRYGNRQSYLTAKGISEELSLALRATAEDVKNVIVSASEHSVYAYNDDINKGFITLPSGVRVGVCGETVYDRGNIITVKNYSSVNIRIPHEIHGCADCIMRDIVSNSCRALIVSPPGAGKTTMLRDISRQLSDDPPHYNVLIADERNELSCTVGGVPRMSVGSHTDVISGSTKSHAFECAVRSMRPDVIVTDEIFGAGDIDIIKEAIGCGIAVIASAHAADIDTFARRSFASVMVKDKLFERYYFLSHEFGKNHIACVADSGLNPIDVR